MGDLPTFQSRICHPSSAICYLLFAILFLSISFASSPGNITPRYVL